MKATHSRPAAKDAGLVENRYTQSLIGLAALSMAIGVAVGSIVLVLFGAAVGWVALYRSLPSGGVTAAFAVGILWTNAGVIVSDLVNAPVAFALLPQLLLAALTVGRVFVRQRGIISTPAFRALLVHGVALGVAAIAAADPSPVPIAIATFVIEGPILWFVVLNGIDDRRRLEASILALVVVVTLLGALSILQFSTKTYTNEYLGFAQVDQNTALELEAGVRETPRLGGQIGEQNRYAQTLLVVLPLALALAARKRRTSAMYFAAAAITVGGIALTASRGAALGLLATMLLMVILRLVAARAFVVMLLALVIAVAILPGYRDRIASTASATQGLGGSGEVDGSTLSRITENLAALNMFTDNPIIGVGPSGYPAQYEAYAERVGLNVRDQARQPHNLFLGMAAETGLLGLLSYLAVTGLVLARLLRVWLRSRSSQPEVAAMAAAFTSAIFAYLVSGVFLHLSFERYMWLILALGDAAGRILTKGPRETTKPGPIERRSLTSLAAAS